MTYPFIKTIERVAPRILLILRASFYARDEPELTLVRLFCKRSMASVDVGAHKGVYARTLCRNSMVCYAFEPNPSLAVKLRRSVPKNVVVINAAVSDADGVAQIRIPKSDLGLATIERANGLSGVSPEDISVFDVNLVTLDTTISEPVSLIKIDVEGHELGVLRGSLRILTTWRPMVLVEVENRHRPNQVVTVSRFFGSLGYQGFFLIKGRVYPLAQFDEKKHQAQRGLSRRTSGIYVNNFFYAHESKLVEFRDRLKAIGIDVVDYESTSA